MQHAQHRRSDCVCHLRPVDALSQLSPLDMCTLFCVSLKKCLHEQRIEMCPVCMQGADLSQRYLLKPISELDHAGWEVSCEQLRRVWRSLVLH